VPGPAARHAVAACDFEHVRVSLWWVVCHGPIMQLSSRPRPEPLGVRKSQQSDSSLT
jgi:hypothetical protein